MFPRYQPGIESLPRHLFFTGKGGVGKTSLACATALRLAEAGRRVLLVSTDPASNLDEVLGVRLGRTPSQVAGSFFALNIQPEEAAATYRERVIGPLRGVLPAPSLRAMEESLSGSCTVEIAAFDEFTSLLTGAENADFEHIVFDTAPTGHTLRLMSLAKAWDQFLSTNTTGGSCLGPLAGLEKQRAAYSAAVDALANPAITSVILVSRPQTASLREANRAADELRALGIENLSLVLNGVFPETETTDPLAKSLVARESLALANARGFLSSLPVSMVALRTSNVVGLENLRYLLSDEIAAPDQTEIAAWQCDKLESATSLIDDLAKNGHGLIMTMGKGGVGKTTVAAAIAVALAQRGCKVHLSTTDPAAHVGHAMPDTLPGLTLGTIDPIQETEAYRAEVLAASGSSLDAAGRDLLEEDLRSPCTEEVAVFRAFAREVAKADHQFVVMDTAPTGHTILLLDASQSYHRELERQSRSNKTSEAIRLLPRLRDPVWTRILLVTTPEATPVHEAAALQDDLRRAGIEPFAWIINQSLQGSGSRDPILRRREAAERRYIDEVTDKFSQRTALLRWQSEEPVGTKKLARLLSADR